MPLPLPNLDTRRWSEVVDQGRGMVPQLAPAWTDHNIHDPGITLIELCAWLTAEEQGFRANRIGERHRRKFLALAGVAPRGAQPASVLLVFGAAGAARDLPAGLTLAAHAGGLPAPFATAAAIYVSNVALAAVQSFDGRRFSDFSRQAAQGLALAAFGEDPLDGAAEGPALYFGFDAPLPPGHVTTLWIVVNADDTSYGDRDARRALHGRPHHSVRTSWEVRRGGGWVALGADELQDATRSLTLNGPLRVKPNAPMEAGAVGEDTRALYYLRCRVREGRYDAAPVLRFAGLHAVRAEQRRRVRGTLAVGAGVVPPAGAAPVAGATGALHVRLNAAGEVAELAFNALGTGPRVLILDYRPSGPGVKGSISATLALAGTGDGWPTQQVRLANEPFDADRAEVWIDSDAGLAQWRMRADLDASTPTDPDFAIQDGENATFGDGARGRVVPPGRAIFALGSLTRGEAGNVAAGAAWHLAGADDVLNRALLGADPATIQATLGPIRNALPARGGEAREDLRHAMGRALESLWAHERLVELAAAHETDTLDQIERAAVLSLAAPRRATGTLDVERIALATPGAAIARARAFADVDPDHPCLRAPGRVTLVVLPYLPARRPAPSAGLLSAVRRHLQPRRILGMRLAVSAPRYSEVRVRARLKLEAGAPPDPVLVAAAARLDEFFHPLRGGERGRGWPFGRDVYRSEVLHILADTPGVEAVALLELIGPDGAARCGNVCVGPGSLVAAGPHEIAADD